MPQDFNKMNEDLAKQIDLVGTVLSNVAENLINAGLSSSETYSLVLEMFKSYTTPKVWRVVEDEKPIVPEKANVKDYIAIRESLQKIARIMGDPKTPIQKVEHISAALREYYSQ